MLPVTLSQPIRRFDFLCNQTSGSIVGALKWTASSAHGVAFPKLPGTAPVNRNRPFSALRPIGIVAFTATGRIIASLCDGRPNSIGGPRAFSAFCGTYTFDGTRMVYEVEESANPDYRGSTQVRDARFDGNRLMLRPPMGFRGAPDVTREPTWERIG
jgi:hypothetical protein